MTLITNYIGKDYIIIAGDKRKITQNETKKTLSKTDDEIKLFAGNKYCIGIQGDVENKKINYIDRLTQFIEKNHDLVPPELIDRLIKEFSSVAEDERVEELNFTVSGANDNELFSYFVDAKNQTILNCIDVDKMGIRFNDSNEKLHGQAMRYLDQYMGDNKLSNDCQIKDLKNLKLEDIINRLKYLYVRFDEGTTYATIGPIMDYYIIYKDGVIEDNIG